MAAGSPYMSLGEAADALDVDRRRLKLLLDRYEIATIEDPLDFRKRLVSRLDVQRLADELSKTGKAAA